MVEEVDFAIGHFHKFRTSLTLTLTLTLDRVITRRLQPMYQMSFKSDKRFVFFCGRTDGQTHSYNLLCRLGGGHDIKIIRNLLIFYQLFKT